MVAALFFGLWNGRLHADTSNQYIFMLLSFSLSRTLSNYMRFMRNVLASTNHLLACGSASS